MAELDSHNLTRAAELISALDSPLRLQLLLLLNSGPHVVHELVTKLGKSQPLISQHLRVLKKAKLVEDTRSGREVVYRLLQPKVVEIIFTLADPATVAPANLVTDELSARRINRDHLSPPEMPAAFANAGTASIVDPPSSIRPATDPGLIPPTPSPCRD